MPKFEAKVFPYNKASVDARDLIEICEMYLKMEEALEFYAHCGEIWVSRTQDKDGDPDGHYVYLQDEMKNIAREALAQERSNGNGRV